MDRSIVYPQEQGRSTDFLFAQRAGMIGLSKLAEAMLGVSTFVAGLSVAATSPASLSVQVNPGQIYDLANVDSTAYGALTADTTHQILKQGLLMDASTLSCPAPTTAGYSINYLIQATYQDSDTTNVVLPYFNSANPSQPLSGQNNSGAAQATERQGLCVVAVKAGAAATTGTQTTPSPDAGYVGLAVVTVANGQSTITSGNISTYSGAPYLPAAGVVSAFQTGYFNSAIAGGTADAITVAFTPTMTAFSPGVIWWRATAANATTTPTLKRDGLATKTLVKGNGLALAAGDIPGAGAWMASIYDATLDKEVLLNPATGVSQVSTLHGLTAVPSANTMVVTVPATPVQFRDPTSNTAAPYTRTPSSAPTLTIPSGATLGSISGQASRIIVLELDASGTVELAVVNESGGVSLDEEGLISTTAISAAATSANVVYSTTARTNVPYRVVGVFQSTQATAGTWVTAPTVTMGIGGQSLAAMQSIGFGQLWQTFDGSRAVGATYYNTKDKPIMVYVTLSNTTATGYGIFNVNGNAVGWSSQAPVNAGVCTGSFIVPPGASYSVTNGGGTNSVTGWHEMQ